MSENRAVIGEDFDKWFVEFSVRLTRSIPPRMVRLADLEREIQAAKDRGADGDVDLFSSLYRYETSDPYVGPVIGGLCFDLDDARNVESARKETVELIRFLKNELGVKEDSIDVCFSGSKGFSLVVNRRVFGFEPSGILPLIHRSIAREMVERLGLKTVDLKIYERRRLWRLPNSRNSKSMLYKVRLTVQELESQSVEQIRQIALRSRALVQRPEHKLSEQARAFYLKHKAMVEEDLSKKKPTFTSEDYKDKKTDPCIDDVLDRGEDEGYRNQTTFDVAVYFARRKETLEAIKAMLLEWNSKNRPPLSDSEIERTIESAHRGVLEDKYHVGCSTSTLWRHCFPAKCKRCKTKPQPLTPDIAEFLKSPDLHENTVRILAHRIVGEDNLKMLLFYNSIGAVVHKTPSGAVICDRYGVGKSYVERTIASIFPSNRVEQPTSLTEEAVNYLAESYSGKIVRIDETYGMEKGLPRIRSWMTEGRIEHWVAPSSEDKDKRTRKISSEGCPVFMTSTTETPEPQFARRNWILFCDVSREQTDRIHAFQDDRRKLPKIYFKPQEDETALLSRSVCYVMDNGRPVLIPFKFSFPSEDVRSRGDKDRFDQLIMDVANWHMLQRRRLRISDDEEYIIAEEQDFYIALEVATPFLKTTLSGLDKTSLQVIEFMQARVKEDPTIVFTIKIIQAGVRKEDGSAYSEQYLREKLELLERDNKVSINKDKKPTRSPCWRNNRPQSKGLSGSQMMGVLLWTNTGKWARS